MSKNIPAAYDKKAKAPKNTKEDLGQPLKESKIKPAMSTYVMTQSLEVDAEIGGKIYKLKKGDVVKVVEYDEDNGLAFLNINGKVYTTYDLLDTAKFNKGIKLKIVESKKKIEEAGKIVFVLHHTNQGTSESGEIHSIYTTESSALAAMAEELEYGYDGVTVQENEDDDYIHMYITEQFLKNE